MDIVNIDKDRIGRFTVTEIRPQTVKYLLETKVWKLMHSFAQQFNTKEFFNSDRFLSFKDEKGVSNLQKIKRQYAEVDRSSLDQISDKSQILVFTGTELCYPRDLERVMFTQGIKSVVNSDLNLFYAKVFADLAADEGYKKTYRLNEDNDQMARGLSEKIPDISVWVWSRALSFSADEDMNGQFIDVSQFVLDCKTSVGKTGGAFSLQLAPIVCELGDNGVWKTKPYSIKNYNHNGQNDYIAESTLFETHKSNKSNRNFLKRSQFLFHNIIQANDLIFIRFETLQMEKEQRYKDAARTVISGVNLKDRIYDMIGLVEANTLQVDFSNNMVNCAIYGKDLTKLLIDEGDYFYATQVAQGAYRNKNQSELGLLQHRKFTGENLFLSLYKDVTVAESLRYVLTAISEIEVIPDSVLSSYKKTLSFSQDEEQTYDPIMYEEADKKLILAKQTFAKLRLDFGNVQDDINAESSQVDLKVTELCNIFQAAYEQNKLDLSQTYYTNGSFVFSGNTFETIVDTNEKPFYGILQYFFSSPLRNVEPLNSEQLQAALAQERDAILKVSKYVAEYIYFINKLKKENALKKKIETKGIWKLINFLFDESTQKRVLVDGSLANMQGSLLNFCNRICQDPFMEFFGDTYGDRYYFTARTPPFHKQAVLDIVVNGEVTTEEGVASSLLINITPEEVIEEALNFNEENIYTWIHFTPKLSILSNDNRQSVFYFPPLELEPYIKIWGSRPLSLVHNYLPFTFASARDLQGWKLLHQQAFEDMKLLVESHAYLPFTRQGAITLIGDRRIKRGSWIRYPLTGEIFYVDVVSHTYKKSMGQISRYTTLQVSRGMVEEYVKGKNVPGVGFVSYFDIVQGPSKYSDIVPVQTQPASVVTKSDNDVKANVENKKKQQNTYAAAAAPNRFTVRHVSNEYANKVIKASENPGLTRRNPYPDEKGYSVGYGHYLGKGPLPKTENGVTYTKDYVISDAHAEKLLREDLRKRENLVLQHYPYPLTQNEFDALFDIFYGGIGKSKADFNHFKTLVRNYKNNPSSLTALTLKKYWSTFALTSVSEVNRKGLANRRQRQIKWFFKNKESITDQVIDDVYVPVQPSVNPAEIDVPAVPEEPEQPQITDQEIVENNEQLRNITNQFSVNEDVFRFFLRRHQFGSIPAIAQSNLQQDVISVS